MKLALLRVIRFFGGRHIARTINMLVRRLARLTHGLQFKIEWGLQPTPEWFDHFLDQYYLWSATRTPLWVERGVFGLLAIKPGARVLELCCGDGFNAYHFYSVRAGEIISVDIDPDAIASAQRNFKLSNVSYRVADIRKAMPEGAFDNVVWDAAIEHFTPVEIAELLAAIKSRLRPGGLLSGYTIVERKEGKSHHDHEYEFKSKEDLQRLLQIHFRNVKVLETLYPSRHNLYFFAGESDLPV